MSMFYIGEDKKKEETLESLDDVLPGSLGGNQDLVIKQKFDIMRQAAERTNKQSRGMNIVQSSRPISARGIGSSSRSNSSASNSVAKQGSFSNTSSSPSTPHSYLKDDLEEISGMESSSLGSYPNSARSGKTLEQELHDRGINTTFDPLAGSRPLKQNEKVKIENESSSTYNNDDDDHKGTAGLDARDIKTFVCRPPPQQDKWVRCYIKRDKSSISSKMYPRYFLFAEKGDTFLLSAKKRKVKQTSNYCISFDREDINRNDAKFVGKLRSNFIGTEFQIFDNGEKPKKMKHGDHLRNHMGAILYETNLFGSKGPRKFNVVLPDTNNENEYHRFPDNGSSSSSIVSKFKANDLHHLRVFQNKFPTWNPQYKAYVLNFNGRVTKASVKNFQLVENNNPNKVYLQFGKVSEDLFNLDYKHPLNALQAFSIAISSFDMKLACE
ncbi:hypothetical protein ABK040_010091 [Willaertia magna]